jgi:mitochondrial enoyl-[acyl-carrier protein] reductase / trans-2-enoyl-CoA reductase
MKAVLIPRFGPALEVAEVADLPEPAAPGPGQVLLDILATPINPSDFLNFQGRFGAAPPPLPIVAGGEAVGQVSALGAGVTHLRPGDRVLALHAGRGNWRQRVLAPAAAIRPLPATADPLQLAMLAVNPATALHMLTRYATLSSGDWVLQNAGNSAVGHCVVWLARQRGLRTVSVVRRDDQVAPLQAIGGDVVLVDGPDLPVRVAAAVGEKQVRLALDAVAGSATGRLARCLAHGGTLVVYGLLSAPECTVPAADLVFRDIALRGYWFTPWFEHASPEERTAVYDELSQLVADGVIRVAIEACYPLDRVHEALAHAARPGRTGKILLLPNPAIWRPLPSA